MRPMNSFTGKNIELYVFLYVKGFLAKFWKKRSYIWWEEEAMSLGFTSKKCFNEIEAENNAERRVFKYLFYRISCWLVESKLRCTL